METFLQKTPSQQKVYAIAFVLTMREVLAQDGAKSKQSGQVAEILNSIMQAVKEPSADHLYIYIGMVIAMAFLGFFVYRALGVGKPKLHKEQLLLSDVVDSSITAVDKDAAFHKKLD